MVYLEFEPRAAGWKVGMKIQIEKSVDFVLGTRTWSGKMEGADESTEPWRHPILPVVTHMWAFL